jgi:hypothetical protein
MKVILILLNLIILNKGCTESKINQDAISFEYSAMSRGQFLEIKVNNKTTSIQKNRSDAAILKPTEEKQWEALINLTKSITIENIPNLKAPSEKRFFDGAAIGNLTVIYEGTIYKTESFDHGNPPKEIVELVKEMLSISENIE